MSTPALFKWRHFLPESRPQSFQQTSRIAIESDRPKAEPFVREVGGEAGESIRLDDDILQWFREQAHLAGGGNYQTLIDEALRQHIQQRHEPLEETLRLLREELRIEK